MKNKKQLVRENVDFFKFHDEFFKDMKKLTKFQEGKLFNVFAVTGEIDTKVYEYFSDKLDGIYNYFLNNNLKPEDMDWDVLGGCLFRLVIYPPEKVPLPENIKQYVLQQFDGKKIKKEYFANGCYIVFDKN